jgi:photosystem II stability/assembly factor-like uncharacterized protein
VVGDAGTILTSADTGVVWTARTSGTTENLFGVACPSTSRCVAVGRAGSMLWSENGGVTWTSSTIVTPS